MKNDISAPVPRPTAIKKIANSKAVHSFTQKSHKLYHLAAQKPISQGASLIRKVGRSMDFARSKSISHLSPRLASITKKAAISPPVNRKHMDVGPIKRPLVKKVVLSKSEVAKPAKILKQEAITEAFDKLSDDSKTQRNIFKRKSKLVNIISICLIVIGIAGCVIYFNLPMISVKIASMQAGIEAKYPEFLPEGYSLNYSGPVSSSDGQVTINFRANIGNSKFAIKQSKSSWDSTAVKDWVDGTSKGAFNESKDKGLTIYTYGGNAAWVNGGILYSITGDALLKADQIRRIATSL